MKKHWPRYATWCPTSSTARTLGPDLGEGHKCSDFVPPVQELGPHVAALGMRFYTGKQFPAKYRNQILIAEHGSWNRTNPIGYRLMLVRLDGDKAVSYAPFAQGWLQGDDVRGRPVDVQVMPDGSLLVSDDRAGCAVPHHVRGVSTQGSRSLGVMRI